MGHHAAPIPGGVQRINEPSSTMTPFHPLQTLASFLGTAKSNWKAELGFQRCE
jgi:hypothetical protein